MIMELSDYRYAVLDPEGHALRDLPDDQQQNWLWWFQAHGLDPKTISACHPIICDRYANTVTVWIFYLDRNGNAISDAWGEIVFSFYKVRLEGPPLPFPTNDLMPITYHN